MHDEQPTEAIATPSPFAQAAAFLEQADAPSPDKVRALAATLLENAGETEQGAQVVAVVQVVRQFIDPAALLPDDPAELDRMLVEIAETVLAARSTGSARYTVIAAAAEPW